MKTLEDDLVYKPEVSIIVTVYQDEVYLNKCLDSVINQDFSNIEVIIVDDGSTDLSGKIIDDFAKKDSRIIAIHQCNMGVSNARNVGIEKASGKYVMFVDGDDWVDEDFVSYALNLVRENCCECGVICLANNTMDSNDLSILSSEEAVFLMYSNAIYPSVCNKVFLREALLENNIEFNERVYYGEDMLFSLEVIDKIERLAIGNQKKYHITQNKNSTTRKKSVNYKINNFISLSIQGKILSSYKKNVIIAWKHYVCCYNRFIIEEIVKYDLVKKHNGLYRRCVKNLRRHVLIPLICEKRIKRKIGWLAYYIFPRFMAIRHILLYSDSFDSLTYI